MIALFQGTPGWPAAPRIEAAIEDRPPNATAPIAALAALLTACRNRGDCLGWRAVGGRHRHTIPTPMGRRQARCVIMRARHRLFLHTGSLSTNTTFSAALSAAPDAAAAGF